MATFEPFTGWRVAPDAAARVVSPAYDALSPRERGETAAANPDSFLNVTRSPEDQLPGQEVDHERLLRSSRATLDRLLAEGAFVRQATPAYQLLRMRLGGHVQTGIVGTVPVRDIGSVVRLHEETRADKEDDLVRHLETVGVSSSPVGLVHPGPTPVPDLVARTTAEAPELRVDADDGLEQEVWGVTDPADIAGIRTAFSRMDRLYLTDGHHRAASAVRLARRLGAGSQRDAPWQRLLVVAFPADELRLEPYHRVVHGIGRDRAATVLEAIRERFEVAAAAPPAPPEVAGTLAVLLADRWYAVRTAPDDPPVDPVAALDVTILHERILRPLLGITDPRTDDRLEFVPGTRGLAELERRAGPDGGAFALPPTDVAELMAVADAGAVMPPKSTWFEPKVRSGMFLLPAGAGWQEDGAVG